MGGAAYDPVVRAVSGSLRAAGLADAAVVVACSGGADSVALLRAVAGMRGRRGWEALRPVVGHVQHHLRDSAEDDAGFVMRLAERLGVAGHRLDVSVPTGRGRNVLAEARRVRYGALRDLAERVGAAAVLTAHHADDQLETLLLRLARGGAVASMGGLWPDRQVFGVRVVRPMLPPEDGGGGCRAVTRDQVEHYLRRLGQDWRDDPGNADVRRARARLRRDVLPALQAINPAAARHAVELAAAVRRLGSEPGSASPDPGSQNPARSDRAAR